MGIQPLMVAGIASALLVATVGFDLAFSQTLTVELQQEGEWRTVARVSLDTDEYQAMRSGYREQNVTRDDVVQGRIVFDNGYPWPSTKAIDVRTVDCYFDDGEPLARVPVGASARSMGEARFEIAIAELDDGGFYGLREPVPVAKENVTYASVHFCRGDRLLGSATFPIVEGSS